IPLLWFGVFKQPIHLTTQLENEAYPSSIDWKPSISEEEFTNIFSKIHDEIVKKTITQVNFTTRYEAPFIENGHSYYTHLKRAQQADYSAYIHTGNMEVLSVSPELFFELNNGTIKTKPMKGTVERGLTYEEDEENFIWLKKS